MRLSPISMVKPGSILGRDVTMPGQGVLLKAGSEITSKDIQNLFHRGIHKLYIMDSLSYDAKPYDSLMDATRISAVDEVYKVLTSHNTLGSMRSEDLVGIQSVSERMVEDICAVPESRIPAHDLRGYDDYTFRHSVNVTAIALALARTVGLTRRELNELAIAGLLHDIGKMSLSPKILNKNGPLNEEEFSQVRRHPVWGYDLLSEKTNTSPRVWAIARQHHETLDGKGYPDARSAAQIHPWVKIVTIADLWDALRSNRPYKHGWPAKRVIEFMSSDEFKDKLDQRLLKTFLGLVVPFPNGTLVRLNTRELAVVIEQEKNHADKPLIRIVAAPNGQFYREKEARMIRLAIENDFSIQQTVS